MTSPHRDLQVLEQSLPHVCAAPKDAGTLELIVRRPDVGRREILTEAQFNEVQGLVGDRWAKNSDAKVVCQVTLMNSRAIAAIAGEKENWPPAGDQLYVDLDLSEENLPAGSRVQIGEVIFEISEYPHTGCKKFVARFGADAKEFVNSPRGLRLRLRGVNARVLTPGVMRTGDPVQKIPQ